MRWTASLFVFLATPAFAAPPLCVLPSPTAVEVDGSSPKPSVASPASPATGPSDSGADVTLPTSLVNLPFAKHLASAGAAVSDLGVVHALRTIAARHGNLFMLFEVAPDGDAGVSGVPIDLSLTQLQSVAVGNITDIGVKHGLHGYFVRSGHQFQVFYGTPDGGGLIPGVMWDASGKDVTRQQVSQIPGAVPTVVVGGANSQQVSASQAIPLLEKATYGTIGSATAPKVFMMIDPQCIYSIRAFQELQPYVRVGQLKLAIVPLSVLDYEDNGQSTRSALALLSDPADRIVPAWQSGNESNAPDPAAQGRLRNNMAIAQAVGLKGTPMFWWQKPDGSTRHLDGLPPDVQGFVSALGS
jgi:thiol:disulfide interchange protein DsbG